MNISSTYTPSKRPPFNEWIRSVYNRPQFCYACKKTFKESEIKRRYISDGDCVGPLNTCPHCGSEEFRPAKYNEI